MESTIRISFYHYIFGGKPTDPSKTMLMFFEDEEIWMICQPVEIFNNLEIFNGPFCVVLN